MRVGWGLGAVASVVAAAVGAPGCGEDYDLPAHRVWESEHFEYFARDSDPGPCPALADVFEQHFAAVRSTLGLIPWPADRIIRYYKYVDALDSSRNSRCPTRGACGGSDVRSYEAFHEHELIHAYLHTFGQPPAVFQEGIAMALSCDSISAFTDVTPIPWADAVRSNDPIHELRIYTTGAKLVTYLLLTYGAAPFMQLYTELPHSATPDMVDAAIQRIYGASADDVWQLALAAPGECIPVGRCAREEIPVDGSSVAVGQLCGVDYDRRTFTLPAGGNVTVGTSANIWYRFGSCDHTPRTVGSSSDDSPGVGPNLTLTELAAGRYFVEFANQPSDLAVTAPAGPSTGGSCDVARPMSLATTAGRLPGVRIIPPAGGDWLLNVQLDQPYRYSVQPWSVRAMVCPTCDLAAPECQSNSDWFDLSPMTGFVVRVVNAPSTVDPFQPRFLDLVPRSP